MIEVVSLIVLVVLGGIFGKLYIVSKDRDNVGSEPIFGMLVGFTIWLTTTFTVGIFKYISKTFGV